MFLARRPIHHHIRPLPQKKATPKWYRAVYCENLTGWSERRRGIRDVAGAECLSILGCVYRRGKGGRACQQTRPSEWNFFLRKPELPPRRDDQRRSTALPM